MPNGRSINQEPQQRNISRSEDVRGKAERLHRRQRHRSEPKDRLQKVDKGKEVARAVIDPSRNLAKQPSDRKQFDTITKATVSTSEAASNGLSTPSAELTFYPAYCNAASPTYFNWVKLTTYDIHNALQPREGYHHSLASAQNHGRYAPQLLYYRNHPIQFVQVVGIVVSVEEYFDRFWLFTIDDSSQSTIDVVCRKPEKKQKVPKQDQYKVKDTEEEDELAEQETEIQTLSDLVEKTVQIGAVLQAKGTITLFQRSNAAAISTTLVGQSHVPVAHRPPGSDEKAVRQLALNRLTVVRDTNHEIQLLDARTSFYNDVLNKAWTLSKKEVSRLHRKAIGELEVERKHVRRRAEKKRKLVEDEIKDTREIVREYQEEEELRKEYAQKAKEAGELLQEAREASRTQNLVDNSDVHQQQSRLASDATSTDPAKERKNQKKRLRKSLPPKQISRVNEVAEYSSNLVDSFEALDSEKSALLRAAFG